MKKNTPAASKQSPPDSAKPVNKHSDLPGIATVPEIVGVVAGLLDPVYLVGGTVRDLLLGKQPKDYDFSTPLTPEQMETALLGHGIRIRSIGRQYGTLGFSLQGQAIEVTTFRIEHYREGSRKPEVEFVADVTHDLSRRDFTINALALRPDGRLIDPFNGATDTNHGIIRSVGQPAMRFHEDPLRMLRAARFASQHGFTVEADTLKAITHKASLIMQVSRERWSQELDSLLLGSHVTAGLEVLMDSGLMRYVIPEIALQHGYDQDSPYHELDLWQHSLKTVSLLEADLNLRWAGLLHDVGKPFCRTINRRGYSNYADHEIIGAQLATKIGTYLRWPKHRIDTVSQLVLHHLEAGSPIMPADGAATKR